MRRRTVVLLSLSGALGALLLAGVLLRSLGMEAQDYRVPSEAMVPTVQIGDRVTLNLGAYEDEAPEVGDIVIHHPPRSAIEGTDCGGGTPPAGQMCARPSEERAGESFIKRVVAGPGERVSLRGGRVVRDGTPAREPYIEPCGGGAACDFPRPITIPEGHYLLLGDNRGSSDDSRFWGPVPLAWIQGRVEDCDLLRISCSPIL
jgi:signal peptidase I